LHLANASTKRNFWLRFDQVAIWITWWFEFYGSYRRLIQLVDDPVSSSSFLSRSTRETR
jgi:hypothetical protein